MDALTLAAAAPPTGTPLDFFTTGAKVVGAVKSLFGGGGGYAVDTGYEISGTVGADGFQGTVFGLSQNGGEQYRNAATGEQFYLSATAADQWAKQGLTAADGRLPFTGKIPYNFQLAFDAVNDLIINAGAEKKAASAVTAGATAQSFAPAAAVPAASPVYTMDSTPAAAPASRFSPALVAALVLGGLYVIYR